MNEKIKLILLIIFIIIIVFLFSIGWEFIFGSLFSLFF